MTEVQQKMDSMLSWTAITKIFSYHIKHHIKTTYLKNKIICLQTIFKL